MTVNAARFLLPVLLGVAGMVVAEPVRLAPPDDLLKAGVLSPALPAPELELQGSDGKPLNVVIWRPGLSVTELADLGVRRISVGGALARAAWGAVLAVAEQIKAGSFEGFVAAPPSRVLNDVFANFE